MIGAEPAQPSRRRSRPVRHGLPGLARSPLPRLRAALRRLGSAPSSTASSRQWTRLAGGLPDRLRRAVALGGLEVCRERLDRRYSSIRPSTSPTSASSGRSPGPDRGCTCTSGVGSAGGLHRAGACYRLATALFFLGFSYVFLLEQARYLNHLYLVCLLGFLLIAGAGHRALSFDAWLRPRSGAGVVPAWALWASVPGRRPVHLRRDREAERRLAGRRAGSTWLVERSAQSVLGPWLAQEWLVFTLATAGLLFDLAIVPLLLWRARGGGAGGGAGVPPDERVPLHDRHLPLADDRGDAAVPAAGLARRRLPHPSPALLAAQR